VDCVRDCDTLVALEDYRVDRSRNHLAIMEHIDQYPARDLKKLYNYNISVNYEQFQSNAEMV
jgi:hypothetical protein